MKFMAIITLKMSEIFLLCENSYNFFYISSNRKPKFDIV